ncbi:hypothetical protein HPB48_012433 [Haemaphysalis longicornis]|uniref:Uncharacterized protein n=1 Tax=Haemaphysalis longicornis TaxID=44386 RepID=A0A9J6G368_HAELO|nr:hypothetical protein HPB48_012433 [Haemaphysalis longicornis]
METFVLIPKELSLVLSDRPASTTTDDATTHDHHRPAREVTAAVWSNSRISRGTRFLPFQGTVRLDKLDIFGTLDRQDVSVLLRFVPAPLARRAGEHVVFAMTL